MVNLIQTSPDRETKPVLTYPETAEDGTFAYLRFPSARAEAEGIAAIARARVDAGVEPDQVLVLVRSGTAAWRNNLAPVFDEVGLQLANAEWVEDVLQEVGIRRAIAIAHLAQPEHSFDSLSWLSLTRHLTPQVGDAFVEYVLDNSNEDERFGPALIRLWREGFTGAPTSAARAAETIQNTRSLVQQLNIEGAVLGEHGWGGWIRDNLGDELSPNAVKLLEMVGLQIPEDPMDRFLAQLEPLGKDLAAKEAGGVRLMTMSSSKGLTVNTTIVAGVEAGLIPMPPPKGHRPEEIRLLYVALTRATDMCVMTFAATRYGQLARQGSGRQGRRMRSPLVETLDIGAPQDGNTFVRNLIADV